MLNMVLWWVAQAVALCFLVGYATTASVTLERNQQCLTCRWDDKL